MIQRKFSQWINTIWNFCVSKKKVCKDFHSKENMPRSNVSITQLVLDDSLLQRKMVTSYEAIFNFGWRINKLPHWIIEKWVPDFKSIFLSRKEESQILFHFCIWPLIKKEKWATLYTTGIVYLTKVNYNHQLAKANWFSRVVYFRSTSESSRQRKKIGVNSEALTTLFQ